MPSYKTTTKDFIDQKVVKSQLYVSYFKRIDKLKSDVKVSINEIKDLISKKSYINTPNQKEQIKKSFDNLEIYKSEIKKNSDVILMLSFVKKRKDVRNEFSMNLKILNDKLMK